MKKLALRLNISETGVIMCAVIGCLFVLFAVAGLLVSVLIYPFERPAAYVSGLLVGCLLSAVKVILLEKTLDRSADMESGMAKGYASLMAILRYALTIGVLLLVVFFRGVFGLFGIIIGILSLQAAAYVTAFIIRKKNIA